MDEKEGEQDGESGGKDNKKAHYQTGHMWYHVKLLPGLIGLSSERP